MRRLLCAVYFVALLLFVSCLSACVAEAYNKPDDLRGVWVATVLNLDYPKRPTTSAAQLKQETDDILNRVQQMGMNAVFLQVRPAGDAFYPSKLYPWSQYLTGRQGLAPEGGFDPLAYWVEGAHKRGIALHAWINPYRVTRRNGKEPVQDISMLHETNPVRQNPDWAVSYNDGNLYLNPGIPEVRRLIVDGIMEVVRGYEIDGIHFDDYFYPGAEFDDEAAYQKYGKGMTHSEWRRENVNQLLREIHTAINKEKSGVMFGVSPFGIWANKKNDARGSDTKGNQSITAHYADSLQWIADRSIDYIMPQIYWHIGHDKADYATLLAWWAKAVQGSGVKLYIGQAAYRTGNKKSSDPWYGDDELFRQLDLNARYPEVSGSVFFRYGFFVSRPTLQEKLTAYYEDR